MTLLSSVLSRRELQLSHISFPLSLYCQLKSDVFCQFYTDEAFSLSYTQEFTFWQDYKGLCHLNFICLWKTPLRPSFSHFPNFSHCHQYKKMSFIVAAMWCLLTFNIYISSECNYVRKINPEVVKQKVHGILIRTLIYITFLDITVLCESSVRLSCL